MKGLLPPGSGSACYGCGPDPGGKKTQEKSKKNCTSFHCLQPVMSLLKLESSLNLLN